MEAKYFQCSFLYHIRFHLLKNPTIHISRSEHAYFPFPGSNMYLRLKSSPQEIQQPPLPKGVFKVKHPNCWENAQFLAGGWSLSTTFFQPVTLSSPVDFTLVPLLSWVNVSVRLVRDPCQRDSTNTAVTVLILQTLLMVISHAEVYSLQWGCCRPHEEAVS